MFTGADGCIYSKAFSIWKSKALDAGYLLGTCDHIHPSEADILWFIDLPRDKNEFLHIKGLAKTGAKFVLHILESPLLSPSSFVAVNRSAFDAILTYEKADCKDNTSTYALPVELEPRLDGLPFSKRKLAVMVNSNRVEGWFSSRQAGLLGLPVVGRLFSGWRLPPRYLLKPAQGELYSYRRMIARAFERYGSSSLDIYGTGWSRERISWCHLYNLSLYKCWKSCHVVNSSNPIIEKRQILGRYRFVLAFENFEGSKGYVSEKFFDSLLGGSVPVYRGDTKFVNSLDPACFVNATNFRHPRDLISFLQGMKEGDWLHMRNAGLRLLASSLFSRHNCQNFSDAANGVLSKVLPTSVSA